MHATPYTTSLVRNTIHDLTGNELVLNYSKYEFNKRSGKDVYSYDCKQGEGSFLDNLPDFDLEELVISYIQLKENYYVLSNSIANHSTTIKIECEFISRDPAKKKGNVQLYRLKEAETKS